MSNNEKYTEILTFCLSYLMVFYILEIVLMFFHVV